MILKIKSTNPDFATLIMKNPNGPNDGLVLEPNKNGVFVGHFNSPSEYHLVFLDTKYSYNNDMSNQIDFQSYSNPRIILDMMKVYFPTFMYEKQRFGNKKIVWENNKELKEFDNVHQHEIYIENVYVDSTWIRNGKFLLSRYFPQISVVSKNKYLYTLKIEGEGELYDFMNILTLTFLFLTITNPQKYYIDDALVEKYLQVLKNIENIPYFIVYLFKVRLMKSKEMFVRFKESMDNVLEDLSMTYGNTHLQRIEFIKEHLKENEIDIFDVGCGEMLYLKAIGPSLSSERNYYALDIDEGFGRLANKIANRDNIKCNVKFSNDFNQLKIEDKVDVLITEVIEHMGLSDAKQFIKNIADTIDFNRIIVTTPNFDFNDFYSMETEYRNEDHKFEMTEEQFFEFIEELFPNNKFEKIYIGDEYKGIHPTVGAIVHNV